MILEIFSSFGHLVAEPMRLQDIESKSILPEHESEEQFSEFAVGAGPADSDCCEEPGKTLNFDDQEIQE